MPYTDQGVPHAGSAEVLFTGMFDEPAGTLARNIPRRNCTSGGLSAWNTTGLIAVASIPLPAGLIVSNLMVAIGNTGAVTPSHFWMALTDSQLNVLAVTADQLTAAQAAATAMKLPVTFPYQVPQTGLYYVASSTSSATAPTGVGTAVNTSSAVVAAIGNPVLCGTAGSSATPPAIGSQLAGGVITSASTANLAAWIS